MRNFCGVFEGGDKRRRGIKGGPWLEKGISFLFSTTTMPPKPTPLFRPNSDEEADKAIQEAEDVKAQLACLNAGLVEFNRKVEAARAVKAKQQWERQQLAEEQAEKDWHTEAEEKLAWEWQEQLAELAWINEEVSPSVWNLAF